MKHYPIGIVDDFFNTNGSLKTDIREVNGHYELTMEAPGYKKEDIQVELSDGYLKIRATRNQETNEENEHYVRKERVSGTCARSFYVGDDYTQDDIHASFDNGELTITLPQKVEQKKHTIEIN